MRTKDTSAAAAEVSLPSDGEEAEEGERQRVTSSYVPRPSPVENRCHDTDDDEGALAAESYGAPFSLATAAIMATTSEWGNLLLFSSLQFFRAI